MEQKKFWFLNRVKIFQDLSLEEAELIENMCEVLPYKRKHPIFMPGDPSDRLYILKSGLVKISKVTEEGKELTLSFLSQGDIFGELAVVSAGPRNTMGEAYEDSVVCAIDRKEFLQFIIERPTVALEVTRLLADRRQKPETKIAKLPFKGATARLAGLFLELFFGHRVFLILRRCRLVVPAARPAS